ncbi:hypothetical protein MJM43_32640, partial [Salmonella enterica subsp. enterica serovar Montevideo]|nr:hypothetical protein [Salmonella enterica subsp. enterica serovar Montevideo]
ELTDHMANVRRVFNELIGDDEADTPQEEERSEPWREVWQDALASLEKVKASGASLCKNHAKKESLSLS